jgi:hypothetical protein
MVLPGARGKSVLFWPLKPDQQIGRFRAGNPTVLLEPPQIPAAWGVTMLAAWRLACLLLIPVLLTACSGGGAAGGAQRVPAGMIGAAGGTVTGPGNSQVVIAAGALTQNTAIAIAQSGTGAPPLPAGVVVYGPIFAFTPHGTNFQSAVTMSASITSFSYLAPDRTRRKQATVEVHGDCTRPSSRATNNSLTVPWVYGYARDSQPTFRMLGSGSESP